MEREGKRGFDAVGRTVLLLTELREDRLRREGRRKRFVGENIELAYVEA